MNKTALLLALASFSLSACVHDIKPDDRQSRPVASSKVIDKAENAGDEPVEYEKAIKESLKYTLKDPNSVIDFSASKPERSSCFVMSQNGVNVFYGWLVKVSFNAKNSYGGYGGIKTYHYWFRNGILKGIGEDVGKCKDGDSWR